MVFSSMLFLWIFLPLVLAAYYISPGKIRNGILVFFSLLFYAWGEPLYVFLMLFSVAVNFTGGILIEKYQTRKKKILVATLIINLGLLGYFKYFGTLTEAITGLFSADGTGTTLFQVALPIGILYFPGVVLCDRCVQGRGAGTAQFLAYAFVYFLFPTADRRTYCKISRHCSSDYRKKRDYPKICSWDNAFLLGTWEKGSSCQFLCPCGG